MQRLALLTLCCALVACRPPIDTGPDGGARGPILAGPAGGLFVRECGALDIPPGALASEAELHMAPVTSGIPQQAGRTVIGPGCRITPSTLTFQKDVTLSLPYEEARVPAGGINPADFRIFAQVGTDAPAPLDAPRTDPTLKVVSATTRRLGLFWVSSPEDPLVGEFTVQPPEVVLRVGDTAQLTARVTGLAGEPLDGVEVQWRVVPPRVGSVDAHGLFTAVAPGNATVEARASTLTRSVRVSVAGTTPGPTTFIHDTPFPTGNDLLGGALGADGTLLVAGTNGTVLARSPAGEWSRLASFPLLTLRAAAWAPDGSAVAVGTQGTTGVLLARPAGDRAPIPQTFTTAAPRAVWYDGVHGMAVGTGNDVLVLREGRWVTEYSPSFETLLAVSGDGQGGFVTVGSQGSLYAYDPATRTWDSLYQSQLAVLLTAAVLADPAGSEAWAVGGDRLWHFQRAAGQWTSLNLPATPALEVLTAVGRFGARVVVGGTGAEGGHLLSYTPGAPEASRWSAQPLRGPQVVRAVLGQGEGSSHGYAVGDFGAVWRATDTGFVEESRGFYGDVADVSVGPDGAVVAAVNTCGDAACVQHSGQVMLRAGPADWRALLPAEQAAGLLVHAVLARSASDLYAATSRGLLRFDGARWAGAAPNGSTAPVHALARCGDEVWAVGPRGAVLAGSGTLVARPPATSRDLFAVHCTDAGNVWTAGTGVLLENGTLRNTQGVAHADWRAVYTPAAGEAFVFGEASYGLYWDTERLQVLRTPGGIPLREVSALWGSSIDNLYAVGRITQPFAHGVVLRFDGAGWSLVDAGASRPVTAVDGAGNSGAGKVEVWLGTRGGGVLRGVPP